MKLILTTSQYIREQLKKMPWYLWYQIPGNVLVWKKEQRLMAAWKTAVQARVDASLAAQKEENRKRLVKYLKNKYNINEV